MAAVAEDWSWSSYRAMIGKEKAPAFLTVDWLLGQFGQNRKQAIAGLKQYVEKGIGWEYPEEMLQAGFILGSERFVERIQGQIEAKREFLEIPRPQRYVDHKNIDEIFYEGARQGTDRDKLIYQSYVRHGYTMKEIADYLNVHYVSVSRSINRYEAKRLK